MQTQVPHDYPPVPPRSDLETRRRATEQALEIARPQLHASVQNIHSGSRVMANMAGLMKTMAMTNRIDQ